MSEPNDQNDTLSSRSSLKEISIVSNLISIVTLTSLSFGDALLSQPLSTLPFDLIIEILCRLPVKVLLQLRCVCKLWNSLICDPTFSKKHLSFSTTHHLHFLGYSYPLHKYFLTSYPLHSIFNNKTTKFTQLGDFNPKCLNYIIVGSCNGILCLANYVDGFVLLWNPSIRKFKDLPSYQKPKILHFDCKTYGGFGYDPISDNYKVVVILHYYIRDNGGNFIEKTEVKVHILGTNFWKNIREFPCGGIPSEKNGHFVSGTINWLASKNSGSENTKREMLSISRGYRPPSFILSFNLENESYQEILLPDHKNIDDSSWHLGVLRNCLCMINGDDVWVMKEYGNKDSWTKLFTIPYIQDPRTSYSFIKLVNIFEDDQVLLEYIDESVEGKWTWKSIVYDFKNDIIKLTEFESTPTVCVESLISPYF